VSVTKSIFEETVTRDIDWLSVVLLDRSVLGKEPLRVLRSSCAPLIFNIKNCKHADVRKMD
jgi:hypothetical protein